MRKFLSLFIALAFVVGAYAQNEVRIVQKTGTTVLKLDNVESIELSEYSSWERVNTAIYNYVLYWQGSLECEVYAREKLDGTMVQYKMMGAGDYDFIFEYDKETGACQVPVQQVAVHGGYGPVYVCDIPHYPLQPGLSYDQYPCTYDSSEGHFSFHLIYFVSADLGSSASGSFGHGVETIKFHEYDPNLKDYSFSMVFEGQTVDSLGVDYAIVSAEKGADISKYLITVVKEEQIGDMDSFVEEIIQGNVSCREMTENAVMEFPVTESGNYMAVAVTFRENGTPYDSDVVTFEIKLSVEDDPVYGGWEYLNTATYNYRLYWNQTLDNVKVYYRESSEDEGFVQYKFVNMIEGYDFIVNCNKETGECQVPVQQVAVHSSYGPVFVSDLPHYPLAEGLTYNDYPCSFISEYGYFSLNLIYFVSTDLGGNVDGYIEKGEETILFSGYTLPDYSFSMQFVGQEVDTTGVEYAIIETVKGTDVAKYRMTVVDADADVNATVMGMLDGTVDCETLTESGSYTFPITKSGQKWAVAVTFDAENNPLEHYTISFDFELANENKRWESLGYATYTDDIVSVYLQEPYNYSYKVEVRESKDQPGLYRIINPYEFFGADTSKEYFIEIDATDPAGVIVNGFNDTGLDIGAGNILVSSYAYYLLAKGAGTFEEIKDAGLCGTLADGVITFPVKGLIYAMGEKTYYGNTMGAFALDLNSLTATPDEAPSAKILKRGLDVTPDKGIFLNVKRGIAKANASRVHSVKKTNVRLIPVPTQKLKINDGSQKALLDK